MSHSYEHQLGAEPALEQAMRSTSESKSCSCAAAVIGVGNVLLSDEGFGVHVVSELARRYRFEPEIQLIDGGTMGMELLGFMEPFERLILVDAIEGNRPNGTLFWLDNSKVQHYFTQSVSAHEVGVQDLLFIRSLSENPIKEAAVIGVQPDSLEPGLELSEKVAKQVEPAITYCLTQLAQWGIATYDKETSEPVNVSISAKG